MLLEIIYIITGLIFLLAGSELVVNNAQLFARRLKISELIIGLTILTFGSNAPELATAIKVGLSVKAGADISGLTIGNILGSCLAQVTIVAGICGLVATIYVDSRAFKRDIISMFSALGLMLLVSIDGQITQMEGLLLCLFYLVYLLVLARLLDKALSHKKTPTFIKKMLHKFKVRAIHEEDMAEEMEEHEEKLPVSISYLLKDLSLIIIGLFVITLGANWMVNNSQLLAERIGASTILIGILLGFGTSLPDMLISIKAIQKGAGGIGLGTIMGGNIINPAFVLGSGALISGLTVAPGVLLFEIPFLIACTLIFYLMVNDYDDLDASEAMTLVTIYLLFAFLSIGRGI